MLLVTAISILTEPNMLTSIRVYLFQSQSQWQYTANIRKELLILGLALPYIKDKLTMLSNLHFIPIMNLFMKKVQL